MGDRTRIVLADDHPIFLAGLRQLLDLEEDFEVIGEAATGLSALKLVYELQPNIAVIDVSMPELNGIGLARRLATGSPSTRILILTLHEERAYLNQAVQAGVCGYVLKRSASTTLTQAIRAVMVGGLYIDPAIAGRLFDAQQRRPKQASSDGVAPDLTMRESEVLQMIATGMTNKEIAHKLDIGAKSVETYKARASAKLGLRTRAEIVRYALSQGWMEDIKS